MLDPVCFPVFPVLHISADWRVHPLKDAEEVTLDYCLNEQNYHSG